MLMLSALGCAGRVPQPAGIAKSPESPSPEEPGGNAAEPHAAALGRLLFEPWGWRNDKQDALHVPLADWEKWRRVRYYGVPSFVGFRYGDAHHAVSGVWIRPVEPGDDGTVETCLERFESWGAPQAQAFGVDMGEATTSKQRWAKGDVVVRAVDARIDSIFGKRSYAAAYGASGGGDANGRSDKGKGSGITCACAARSGS